MATNVYIDGFNLYYGAVRGTAHKWLDIGALCDRLLPQDEVNRIRYFTAKVLGTPRDPQAPQRQEAYLRALATVSDLTIHLGHFHQNKVRMPLADPSPGGPKTVEVIKTEEKGSDVNLATYLLLDAAGGECDTAVVMTNDSDLVEPIRLVQSRFGIRVGVINPHPVKYRSRSLKDAATFFKQLRESAIAGCQFPLVLDDSSGTFQKPSTW